MRMSASLARTFWWNASCIDGFGVLTDAGTNSSIWRESISSANESQSVSWMNDMTADKDEERSRSMSLAGSCDVIVRGRQKSRQPVGGGRRNGAQTGYSVESGRFSGGAATKN